MMFSDLCEQTVDVPPDVSAGSLDASNNLKKDDERCTCVVNILLYLRNDIEPCIHLNNAEATSHRVANIVMSAKFEPQRQQSQGVLQRILVPKRDRAKKACQKGDVNIKPILLL
jgi:hypothetical protein